MYISVGGTFCAGYDLKELSLANSDSKNSILPLKRGPMVL